MTLNQLQCALGDGCKCTDPEEAWVCRHTKPPGHEAAAPTPLVEGNSSSQSQPVLVSNDQPSAEPAGALLPCPFCGGKAEIERVGTARVSTIYTCTHCGCSLETGEEWGHGGRWNERAPLSRTHGASDGALERQDGRLRDDPLLTAQAQRIAELEGERDEASARSFNYWRELVDQKNLTEEARAGLEKAREALVELVSMYEGVCSNLPFGVMGKSEIDKDLTQARSVLNTGARSE